VGPFFTALAASSQKGTFICGDDLEKSLAAAAKLPK